MARIFKVNETIEIVCDWVNTRYGFRHDARLFVNGYEREKAKCCYYNRTWEPWEFHSVLTKLIDQTDQLTQEEKNNFWEQTCFNHR
jgi:hypothetical protein